MTFAAPYLLILLLAVPAAAVAYWVIDARRAARSAAWSRQALLPNIVQRPPRKLRFLPLALFLVGLTFLLVGFARPERVIHKARANAPTIVLAVDVSGSMAATDVGETRVLLARAAAIRFLDELPARYEVALVTFGAKVRLVVPPTLNRRLLVARLPTKIMPRSGTAIGDAINSGVAVVTQNLDRTAPQNGYPGAVLLLSDGGQTASGTTPSDAAATAYVDRVPVDTIAIGTGAGSVTQPITVDGFRTTTNIPVGVNAPVLASLSKQSAGTSFRLASAADLTTLAAQLPKVYEVLGPPIVTVHRTDRLSAAVAGVALAFVLAGIAVSGLWFGRLA